MVSEFFFFFFGVYQEPILASKLLKKLQERSSNHVARCSLLLLFRKHLPVPQQYWIDQAKHPEEIMENEK
jgi:hypothetical protein